MSLRTLQGDSTSPAGLRNVAYLARYLGKSEKYVRQHAALFGGMRVGKEWRFDDASIAAGLESLRAPGPGGEPTVSDPAADPARVVSVASARRYARQHRVGRVVGGRS